MSARRVLVLALLTGVLRPLAAHAQLQPPPPVENTDTTAPEERPGRFRVGPFYLTPRIRLGNVGLDTNVLYTPTERQTDVSASGGPGLEVVLPIQEGLRLSVEGGVNYQYFVRTESQRRFVSDAATFLKWKGVRTEVVLGARYGETFGRPLVEVDRRIGQVEKRANGELRRRLFGRTRLIAGGGFARTDTEDQPLYLGTDLHRTLSRDDSFVNGGFEYTLTPKTRLELQGRLDRQHFRFDSTRDGHERLGTFGIITDSTTLISGRVVVGIRQHESASGRREPSLFYASTNATWHLHPRLSVGGVYSRDLFYTAFDTRQGSPIARAEQYGPHLELEFVRNVFLRLSAARTHYRTQHAVRVELAPGEIVEKPRAEDVDDASAELTYRVRNRLRIGATAVYSERRSTFADLGLDGLLIGATIIYTP
jgi:hypothetical protein